MVRINPSEANGLTQISEVNCAQIMTIQKERILARVGMLSENEMSLVKEKLAYMLNIGA